MQVFSLDLYGKWQWRSKGNIIEITEIIIGCTSEEFILEENKEIASNLFK